MTAGDGSFQISHVLPGHYRLEAWYERASESELTFSSRELDIKPGDNLIDPITLHSAYTPNSI
jgi:hypothetical protein